MQTNISPPSSLTPLQERAETHPTLAPNAWHAFGGVWRLTGRRLFSPMQLLGLAAFATVIALPAFTIPSGGPRGGNLKFFLPQLALGFYLMFLVPILAFLSGAGAI